jgi:CRP-like cAMP-binding protein
VAIQDSNLAQALGRLTAGMKEDDLRRLQYLVCVFELKRGDMLVKEGDHTESLYIVQHGALRVSVGQGAGRIDLPEVTAGQWVGEVSLLDPGPASATVSVLRKTSTVLEFSHKALKNFMQTNPDGACVLLSALAGDLADRLHRTSDGMIRNNAGFLQQVEPPAATAEQRGWFKDMLVTLSGKGGGG